MTGFWAVLVTMMAAVNPPAVALAAGSTTTRRGLLGAVAVAAALLLLAVLVATTLIDWLEVAPESFRTAAGIVMRVQGCLMTLNPAWTSPPAGGHDDGPIPLGWPVMANAAAVVGAMTFAADGSNARVIAAAGIALAVAGGSNAVTRSPHRALIGGLARLAGALLILTAVALMFSGGKDA